MLTEEQIEFRELQKENQQITTSINAIMLENNFDSLQKDELWTLIMKLSDNEVEQEEYCNN